MSEPVPFASFVRDDSTWEPVFVIPRQDITAHPLHGWERRRRVLGMRVSDGLLLLFATIALSEGGALAMVAVGPRPSASLVLGICFIEPLLMLIAWGRMIAMRFRHLGRCGVLRELHLSGQPPLTTAAAFLEAHGAWDVDGLFLLPLLLVPFATERSAFALWIAAGGTAALLAVALIMRLRRRRHCRVPAGRVHSLIVGLPGRSGHLAGMGSAFMGMSAGLISFDPLIGFTGGAIGSGIILWQTALGPPDLKALERRLEQAMTGEA